MRNVKNIALITVLSLGTIAFAEPSTPVDYNSATLTATANGATGEAVAFTIPSSTISIDPSLLKTGTEYTISIPVTNSTSNRIINVTASLTPGGTLLESQYTLTPVMESLTGLGLNGSGNIVYKFTITDTTTAVAGKTLSFTIKLDAVATN